MPSCSPPFHLCQPQVYISTPCPLFLHKEKDPPTQPGRGTYDFSSHWLAHKAGTPKKSCFGDEKGQEMRWKGNHVKMSMGRERCPDRPGCHLKPHSALIPTLHLDSSHSCITKQGHRACPPGPCLSVKKALSGKQENQQRKGDDYFLEQCTANHGVWATCCLWKVLMATGNWNMQSKAIAALSQVDRKKKMRCRLQCVICLVLLPTC